MTKIMKFHDDDDDVLDDEELEGLVTEFEAQDKENENRIIDETAGKCNTTGESKSAPTFWNANFGFRKVSLGLLIPLWVITVIVLQHRTVETNPSSTDPNEQYQENDKKKRQPFYQCPKVVEKVQFEEEKSYLQDNVGFNATDEKHFLETFRTQTFDGRRLPLDKFKESIRDFLKAYFVPNIKNGDTIYESACGIGLNLYATLEILQEEANITNVTIYGNEYLEESVQKGRKILNVLLKAQNVTPPKNHLGSICQGDSTNLNGFVPSNSFDFVFTGYISPLWDPLQFNASFDKNYELLTDVCKGTSSEDEKLRHIAQRRQEDWFSSWVTEMVRIAKPGAPVVAEDVASPYCSSMNDWGGVSREFWTQGVTRYGWDVDPRSIHLWNEERNSKRYHVFMRKNDHAR